MKRLIIILFLSLQKQLIIAQDLTGLKVLFATSQKDCVKFARQDSTLNKLVVFTGGGTVVVGQEIFERKYGVRYYDYGCIPPGSTECLQAYSFYVFNYLDKKYGHAWRRTIRRDVFGFKEWRKR